MLSTGEASGFEPPRTQALLSSSSPDSFPKFSSELLTKWAIELDVELLGSFTTQRLGIDISLLRNVDAQLMIAAVEADFRASFWGGEEYFDELRACCQAIDKCLHLQKVRKPGKACSTPTYHERKEKECG